MKPVGRKLFGGDDGAGGYMPLAVATPDGTSAIVVNWVYGNHLGVPLLTTDSAGNASATPNDYLAPGFPGQSRVLTTSSTTGIATMTPRQDDTSRPIPSDSQEGATAMFMSAIIP